MKKILGLIVLLITVAACTVDDDETLWTTSPVLGSWKEMLITSPPGSEPQNVSDCTVTQVSLLYTFYENGEFTILNACDPALTQPRAGTYTLSGSNLTLTEGEAVTTYSVAFLSSGSMELQRLEDDIVTHITNLEKQ